MQTRCFPGTSKLAADFQAMVPARQAHGIVNLVGVQTKIQAEDKAESLAELRNGATRHVELDVRHFGEVGTVDLRVVVVTEPEVVDNLRRENMRVIQRDVGVFLQKVDSKGAGAVVAGALFLAVVEAVPSGDGVLATVKRVVQPH